MVGLKDESEFSENKTNEGVVKISDKKGFEGVVFLNGER